MHRFVFAITTALIVAMPGLAAAAPMDDEIWLPAENERGTSAELLNLKDLVSGDDYPPEAQMADEQGTVDVLVKVDESGKVADCTIQGSSGSAALDSQTCSLFWLRAKFAPARDEAGKPVVSAYSRKITWRLEGEGMPVGLWTSRSLMEFDAKGVATCRLEFEGILKDRMREEYPDHAKYGCAEIFGELPVLAASQSAKGVAGTVVFEQKLIPGEQLSDIPSRKIAGKLIFQTLLHLEIGADGKLAKCMTVRSEGEYPMPKPCEAFPKVFRKPVGKDKKPASVKATGILTFYSTIDLAASVQR